jgi:lysophospholipase L1-like esterase
MGLRVRRVPSRVAVVLMVVLGAAALAHAEPVLKDGDRMVFLGDSITQQQIYTRYVMNYFALRHPEMEVEFRNAGVSGDTAVGAIERLREDVLDLRPDVVSICFGMNDAGYTKFEEERYETFMAGMTVLLSELKRVKAKAVLLTPGPVDPDKAASWLDGKVYNETLARYAEGVKELAARKGLPVYDIYDLLLDVQTRAKADDPEFTMIPDAVHPSPPGQALMAYALLKALGCEEQASGLEIDAVTGEVGTDRCAVEGVEVSEGEVRFTRRDEALPTYFDPEAAAVFEYAPIVEELNQYPFRVSGLQAGRWRLVVEDEEVGTFTAEELAEGVNLATRPGPWQTLGKAVNDSVADQEEIYLQKRRLAGMFGWISTPPAEAEAEKVALMEKLDEVVGMRERARAELVEGRTWAWRLVRVE